ncbi:MAG: GtrA family protein [Rubrobacter sp.]|nr:GtrA family protein [Rubrobacter sp.]
MRKRDRIKEGGKRFSKFSLVGLSNAAVDIGVLNLFLWLEPTRDPVELAMYNAVALVLANANSYVWNGLWTFRGRARLSKRQTGLFIMQALINVAIGSLLFGFLVRPILLYTDIPSYLAGNTAKFISIATASTVSFFLMRYVVFSRKRWWAKKDTEEAHPEARPEGASGERL